MSSRTKQPTNNLPTSEPSPWTEPFQRAQATTAAGKKSDTADQTQAAPKPEDRPDKATHDALSTIFNGR